MTTVRIEPFESVRDEWESLSARLGSTPFLTAGWTEAWWSAFGRGDLMVLAARRDSELLGVLPVVSRRGKLASPTNWHSVVHGPLAADATVVSELYRTLAAMGSRQIDLSFLDEADQAGLVHVLSSAGYRTEGRVIQRSPYLPISGAWEPYWTSRSRNLRGTIRRCRNRLADLGEVAISVSNGEDGLDTQLAEGFAIEGSGWKDERGTAIASRPETVDFYRAISHHAAANGTLRIAFLRIDGRAVAFNLSLESGGHHYLIKLGHDPALNQAGPGTVLTAAMLERAFELRLKTYEFLGAADSYKLRWTDSCHDRHRVQAFSPNLRGRLDRFIQIRGRSFARRILRRPPVVSS